MLSHFYIEEKKINRIEYLVHQSNNSSDLDASAKFLAQQTNDEVEPMARPVRLKWDDHDWSELPHSCPNEGRTHQQTTSVAQSA